MRVQKENYISFRKYYHFFNYAVSSTNRDNRKHILIEYVIYGFNYSSCIAVYNRVAAQNIVLSNYHTTKLFPKFGYECILQFVENGRQQ